MNQPTRPLIIAHRGSSAIAPENTLSAFKQAISDDSDGIEFDVRLTRDLVPVVFHDASLRRVADNETLIASASAESISGYDIGSWFNVKHPRLAKKRFAKERIARLDEVLAYLSDFEGVLYIELKSTKRTMNALAKSVGEVLKRSNGKFRIVVKGFDLESVPLVKKICPEIETAALFAPTIKKMLRKETLIVRTAVEMGYDRLSLHFSLATKKLMQFAKAADLPVTIWTADNPRWIKRSNLLGIDSVITNNPGLMISKRREILGFRLDNKTISP